MAGPDTLAAAIDGLLCATPVPEMAGLDLAARARPPDGGPRPGRADGARVGGRGLRPGPVAPAAAPGTALAADVPFPAVGTGSGRSSPLAGRPGTAGPAASPPLRPGRAAGRSLTARLLRRAACLAGIDTATAALLSARFPYVTPSGVVNGCGRLAATQVEQYVDGSYADSTGLATLASLAPQLMTAIRQHNEYAMASARSRQPVIRVVPGKVYSRPRSPSPSPGR